MTNYDLQRIRAVLKEMDQADANHLRDDLGVATNKQVFTLETMADTILLQVHRRRHAMS